ncbi:MetQ/NlpA family ABC transporter substrate-binding protein [Kineococcus glutinatus]|uniref:MetQ/NlpA family ABC transporter substrate-binding protein n=1 Tax=Kineococcus glutinatus TaxID=1070872 RepID=A0ABP9I3N9_9ACTN
MSEQSSPVLPDKPKRRGPLLAAVAAAVVAVGVVVALLVRGGEDTTTTTAAGGAAQSVRIGVADKAIPYWETYVSLARERLGVDVELVNFSDYSLPNPALAQGEIDLNQFQHIQYLADYNVTADDDIQPIGATAVYPLPLYSTTVDDAAQFPQGAKIAIPDDAINEARGLLVLQAAGLLTLSGGGTAFSTVDDIESAKVEVIPVDASQTANALQSGSAAGAVVNNNYATAANLSTDDIVYSDDPASDSAAPYVNIFAARKDDAANETYLQLAELFHDPAVQAEFTEGYPEAVVRDTDAATLQADLAEVEEDAKAAKAAG